MIYDGAEILDGKIYVVGGFDGNARNILERYDPLTDVWETLPPSNNSGMLLVQLF